MASSGMAVNPDPCLWTPFKELYDVIRTVVLKNQVDAKHDLEVTLRKHKPDFTSLLKHPCQNSVQRAMLKKATTEGLPIYSEQRTQMLSQNFIEEALILSDLFNINEFAAVELLLAGQNQQPNYPGLSRCLVAVLLYYDGQRSLVSSLRTLLQAQDGHLWTMNNPEEVTVLITDYVTQLVEDGLVGKILDLIKQMDVNMEVESLEKDRALGPPKHRKQVIDMYKEIKTSLAECLFALAAQKPFDERDTLRLLAYLREDNSWNPSNTLDPVCLCLLVTLTYCFDNSMIDYEDDEEKVLALPMLSNNRYIHNIHREIMSEQQWFHPEIRAVVRFAWALSLRHLYISQHPAASGVNDYCEEDEIVIEMAIHDRVFSFLRTAVVAAPNFFQEVFYVKRIHGLLTDFIILMPLKVTELRNRGDEAARIIMAHVMEGIEPPSTLGRDFEQLLKLLADLYVQETPDFDFAMEYWYSAETQEPHSVSGGLHRSLQRQIALNKFVRLAGDLLPASLYVPYINMLTGLASSPACAWYCFNLLKVNGMNAGGSAHMVSWDHIFMSMNQYYTNLRRELPAQTFGVHSLGISPQEQEALIAVLKLTQCIAKQNKDCRITLYENQQWLPVVVLFGLAGCSIPANLKAEVLLTLSALAKSPEIAANLWQSLEASQILPTVPGASRKSQEGIEVELEEVESRNEEYPLTRAFLNLINTLMDSTAPSALGAGYRVPGFQPYLEFILDGVFLKCVSRAYKNPSEKWEVASGALEILYKLLVQHNIKAEDFVNQTVTIQGVGTVSASKSPGHALLIHMLNNSELLQMILRILDVAVRQFATYAPFTGKEALEKASLFCLKLIEVTLEREDAFLSTIRETGSSTMVVCMDRLLRCINPSTGKSDHLVNLTKFIVYNNFLPDHTLIAMKVLYLVCRSASIQTELVSLFTTTQMLYRELLQGFVECLEVDHIEEEKSVDSSDEADISNVCNVTRQHLIQLLLNSLNYPTPNLAHCLLGFEVRKPISTTTLHKPGVLGSPRTCLYSLITILSRGITSHSGPQCLVETPQLAELSYHLLYALCANKDTSLVMMKLQTMHDFLCQQLCHLPFNKEVNRECTVNSQSWILKMVAIELRVTALNRQHSHTQRLMRLLLEDGAMAQTLGLWQLHNPKGSQQHGMEDTTEYLYSGKKQSLAHFPSVASSQTMTGTQTRRKILCILDSLDFSQTYPEQLHPEFFDSRILEQVIKSCRRSQAHQGPISYDVVKLHRVLLNELSLHGTTMVGQKSLLLKEVGVILEQVLQRNMVEKSLHSKRHSFEAWRQMTEIVLTACPEDLLKGEARQTFLFELLHDLLIKVAKDDALPELTAPVAGVILIVMANLRQCFLSDSEAVSSFTPPVPLSGAAYTPKVSSRTLFATSLQLVLKGLINYILKSNGGQQKVRTHLYGALLYFLQISQKPVETHLVVSDQDTKGVGKILVDVDIEFENLSKENMSIILSYGEPFLETLCKDICDGHFVGRMMALSVLDTVLSMDRSNQWLNFITSKGYLQHLIDSLVHDDSELQSLLCSSVVSLKHLYHFENKMTFLTRVALSPIGAHSLLQYGIMKRLSECAVFDMRPMEDRSLPTITDVIEDDLMPSPLARYRRLLFAALKLSLAILSSLDAGNVNASKEILMFILSHDDVFHSILRNRHTTSNLTSLQELELTTAVISRVTFQDIESSVELASIEFRGQMSRLQRETMALLHQFCTSEKSVQQLQNMEISKVNDDGLDLKAEVNLAYKKIISNVIAYCRLIITASGHDARYCRILFGPSLEKRNDEDVLSSQIKAGQPANLGIIVYNLKQCSSQFMVVYDSHQQLRRKLSSLQELSSDDLKEFSGVSDLERLSAQQQQELARKRLVQIIGYRSQELGYYANIIENSLFILWRHLEYYLLHCVPLDQQPKLYQTHKNNRMSEFLRLNTSSNSVSSSNSHKVSESLISGVTSADLELLKTSAPTIIVESLMKKLLEINQCYSKARTHYSFIESVVRRIQRLLRLHTGS